MKPLIFLDIDGVLNNMSYNPIAQSYTFDRVNVGYFNYLIEKIEPNFVISSAWRYLVLNGSMTLTGFKYLMQSHGVSEKISLLGVTRPDEHIPLRAECILNYIKEYRLEKIPYIVIDDNDFGFTQYNMPFIKTNSKTGLTGIDCEKIIKHFKEN